MIQTIDAHTGDDPVWAFFALSIYHHSYSDVMSDFWASLRIAGCLICY